MEAVHGDRAAIDTSLKAFQAQYPQFGSTSLGLKDERDLLQADEAGEEDRDD